MMKRGPLLAPLLLCVALSGCTAQIGIFTDVEYTKKILGQCHKDFPHGYWTPGKICYSDDSTRWHEECHEQAYREGLNTKENKTRCHHER